MAICRAQSSTREQNHCIPKMHDLKLISLLVVIVTSLIFAYHAFYKGHSDFSNCSKNEENDSGLVARPDTVRPLASPRFFLPFDFEELDLSKKPPPVMAPFFELATYGAGIILLIALSVRQKNEMKYYEIIVDIRILNEAVIATTMGSASIPACYAGKANSRSPKVNYESANRDSMTGTFEFAAVTVHIAADPLQFI
uniref:Uncharacterized protein n=1 Tax=Glossina pallidipes TaxID=7398 RepID=A0A1A9ZZA9_GLOPL